MEIDFQNDDKLFEPLRPGRAYYLENQQKVSYSDIANEAERIINIELKPELQKYTDMSVQEVQVQSVYEGSIEIIFTVVLEFLNLIGGLKDLYDVVYLIKEIAERHIDKRLCDKFGRYFRVDIYEIAPRDKDYWHFEKRYMVQTQPSREFKRDIFFLLSACGKYCTDTITWNPCVRGG